MGAVKSTEVDTAMIVESIQVLYKYRKYLRNKEVVPDFIDVI